MFNSALSIGGRCKRWYGCLQTTCRKDATGIARSPSKSPCTAGKKPAVLCRHLSVDGKDRIADVEKLLEDATVPEESTVVGDTENWTTSPYPKGLSISHFLFPYAFVLNDNFFRRCLYTAQEPISGATFTPTKGRPQGNVDIDVSRSGYPVRGHGQKFVGFPTSRRHV